MASWRLVLLLSLFLWLWLRVAVVWWWSGEVDGALVWIEAGPESASGDESAEVGWAIDGVDGRGDVQCYDEWQVWQGDSWSGRCNKSFEVDCPLKDTSHRCPCALGHSSSVTSDVGVLPVRMQVRCSGLCIDLRWSRNPLALQL